MTPIYITSSNIDCAAHDGEQLYIRFKNGKVYCYDRVSYSVFDAMVKSESPGKFFSSFVRPKYGYMEMDFDPFRMESVGA